MYSPSLMKISEMSFVMHLMGIIVKSWLYFKKFHNEILDVFICFFQCSCIIPMFSPICLFLGFSGELVMVFYVVSYNLHNINHCFNLKEVAV